MSKVNPSAPVMDVRVTDHEETEAISKDQYIEKRIEALEKEVESFKRTMQIMMQIQTEINNSQHKINENARSCIQALLIQKEKSDS